MMSFIHSLALYSHITVGAYALVAFWLPMLGKKGDKRHRKHGRNFVNAMYMVTASGFIMSILVIIDPVGIRYPDGGLSPEQAFKVAEYNRTTAVFLFMLSLLVFTNIRQAMLVLKTRTDRQRLKTPAHIFLVIALGVMSVILGLVGIENNQILFQIFAGIGILNSTGSIRYIFKKNIKQMEWILEHMGNIIGCGIACYTAFFAFGGRRFMQEILTGNLQLIPWILPAAIGITASVFLTKKYTQQFKIA